jgi:hypothetical protein
MLRHQSAWPPVTPLERFAERMLQRNARFVTDAQLFSTIGVTLPQTAA